MNKKIVMGILFLVCAFVILFIAKASLQKKEITLDQANKIFIVK
jgi:hypothetical protein